MPDGEGRIEPLKPGESPEQDINGILAWTESDWWQDSRMFGVIAHVPDALRGWVHVIVGIATAVDPVTSELMALRGAFVTGCQY